MIGSSYVLVFLAGCLTTVTLIRLIMGAPAGEIVADLIGIFGSIFWAWVLRGATQEGSAKSGNSAAAPSAGQAKTEGDSFTNKKEPK